MLRFLAAAAVFSGVAYAQETDSVALEERARRIHEEVIALDTHVDIADGYATHKADPGRFSEAQVDLPKMRAGGLDAVFLIVYTRQGALTPEGYGAARTNAVEKVTAIQRLTAAYPDEIGLALTADEVEKIARSGRKVAIIGMENAFPLGPSINEVEKWRASGVRYVGITHFGHNQFGDSSNPNLEGGDKQELHGGLSNLGKALVRELNRTGIMIDVSHASKKTMMQAAEHSTAPIIASHSGVTAVAESPRNLDDEQLRALKENGGVVQIVALDTYVKALNEDQLALQDALKKEFKVETRAARAAMLPEDEAEYLKRLEARWEISPRATVSDFVDHIDHAVKIAGIDHVGISSDFDGGGGVVGWDDASETLNVTRELVRRGYSDHEIEKIWSGNLLRVMRAVEKEASRLKKHGGD